jgi:hypothetical protein
MVEFDSGEIQIYQGLKSCGNFCTFISDERESEKLIKNMDTQK